MSIDNKTDNSQIKHKKTISHSQFSNYFTCPYKYYRDYILKEKVFEDSLFMSFGTAIHDAIQLYLKTLFTKSKTLADQIKYFQYFKWDFKHQLDKKKIQYTQTEFDSFIEDGINLLTDFLDPGNILVYFHPDKYELISIESQLSSEIKNNLSIVGYTDLVLKNKLNGNIKIVDIKTSTAGWNRYTKQNFTKTSQLVLYKALYSKQYNIPLHKIDVEFYILSRKPFDNTKTGYTAPRIETFKPESNNDTINEVLGEFIKFVDYCFTPTGDYRTDQTYLKNPGKAKKNCKYCPYLKNKKCDAKQELI